ncbi:MAG: glycosyltransferase family 2 protein [Faecalimonas sp.]|nr:glycosyltransferase family 2 protein [Faecalimonas sp.]
MISVAMATYNGENYIEEQLASIYRQSRKVDEIVISDDASADGTIAKIQSFAKNYPDCKIRLFQNESNQGYKRNFQNALSLCEGDIIFLCDQDDVWKRKKVEVLTEFLEDNPEAALVSSAFTQIDGAGEIVDAHKNVYKKGLPKQVPVSVPIEDLIFHNISQGCSMAMRREIKDRYLQFFTDKLPHDWMINIVAAMQKKCYFIDRALFFYRIHEKNTIGLNDTLALQKKNTLQIRSTDAQAAIRVLEFIEAVDEAYYLRNPQLSDMKHFARRHVQCLQEKRRKELVLQNFNPYYKKLKTIRGRMLDIYFVFSK